MGSDAERTRGDLARMTSCMLMLRLGWLACASNCPGGGSTRTIAHTASAPRLASLALGYAKSPYLLGFAEAIAIKQHTRMHPVRFSGCAPAPLSPRLL